MSQVIDQDKRWNFDYSRYDDLKQEHVDNLLKKYGYTNWYIELGADGWELVLCNPVVLCSCEGVKVLAKKRDMSALDLKSARRVIGCNLAV